MTFTTTKKPVAKGTKTLVTILADGQVIGTRTSARPYRFALVVTRNQEHELAYNRTEAAANEANVVKYSAIARREEPHYSKAVARFGRISVEGSIANGDYLKWAEGCKVLAAKQSASATELAAGPLPEFAKLVVASFHARRALVPSIKPWQKYVAVVEIPE